MKVLVTGDRNWNDYGLLDSAVSGVYLLSRIPKVEPFTLIHGAARGADRMAAEVATRLKDARVVSYPALWTTHGRAAGPIRNRAMYDTEQPDLVLAFHDNLSESKGTLDMVKYAHSKGAKVIVFSHNFPRGKLYDGTM